MRLLALALCAAFAAPTIAQTASMDVGPQAVDFRYQPGEATAPLAVYDGTVTSLGFYGSSAAFSGFHGSQTSLSTTTPGGVVSLSGFDVSVGGNVHVLPIAERGSVYIPIRFQSGGRYLLSDGPTAEPDDNMAVLFGSADVGAGVGAVVATPIREGGFAESLHTFGTAVLGSGVSGDYAMSFPGDDDPAAGAYGMRTATVMLQTEARKLFGSGLGASLGYTFRAIQLDAEAIDGAGGLLNGLTGSNFRSAETSHLIRVGLIF